MAAPPAAHEVERRKRVKLRLRGDLSVTPQKYEGRTYYVVKDPVTLRYYRFKEQEQFLLGFMDGKHTLEEAQQEYEKRFRPERLTLEDLEGFAQQLLTAGLVQNESPRAGQQLIERRKKRKRNQLLQRFTNILYIRIPLFDPDRILTRMVGSCGFFFSLWFFTIACCVMFGAMMLVATHFETFRSKLPSYHEFFSFQTVIYLWIALGVVKVIHEFGHGLSCKKFGGEVHEMGLLFLVFSPAMYCNVSDSWTLPSKWKRIVISAAGIYVELLIASIATFVWWNTPTKPFINNLSLSLMVVCSVSTMVFNANPLMRYDGYYVLADWIEIPNLRERSNRYLKNLFCDVCLGIESPPEPYMALWRKYLFVFYAITSYIYRWVITFFILWFLYNFLRPYKLGVLSGMLAMAALGSMVGWPAYNLVKNIRRRGRLPDMKPVRVLLTLSVIGALVIAVFTVPLPVSRVRAEGVIEVQTDYWERAPVRLVSKQSPNPILCELFVTDGKHVKERDQLARFSNRALENELTEARDREKALARQLQALRKQRSLARDEKDQKQFDTQIVSVEGELNKVRVETQVLEDLLDQETIVRAPCDGVVMGLPNVDLVGRQWNDPNVPLCKVGDPAYLSVSIPVPPAEYSLLQENLGGIQGKVKLPVEVRVPGQGTDVWMGYVIRLPADEAKKIPLALSSRANGPVPIKPSENPEELIPQTQQYLVTVDLEPGQDLTIKPGVRAQVKVHCKKRTLAWWVWRVVNDTFNLGFL